MPDILKSVLNAPLPTLLVVSGLLFILMAIVGRIKGVVDFELSIRSRQISGAIGAILLAFGIFIALTQPWLLNPSISSVIATPVSTLKPSPIVQPISSPTSVAVPIIPTPVVIATSTPLSPRFYNFSVCLQPCNGTNATRVLPERTTIINVQWNYENIPFGSSYVRTWTADGREWIRYSCTWTGSTTGMDRITLREYNGLRSGTWEMSIFINGVVMLREPVQILGNWGYWEPAGSFARCYE